MRFLADDFYKGYYQLAFSDEITFSPITRKLLDREIILFRSKAGNICANFKDSDVNWGALHESLGAVYINYHNYSEVSCLNNLEEVLKQGSWSRPRKWTLIYKADYRDVIENALDAIHFWKVHGLLEIAKVEEISFEHSFMYVRYSGIHKFGLVSDRVTIQIRYFSSGLSCIHLDGRFIVAQIRSCPTPIDKVYIRHFFQISLKQSFWSTLLAPFYRFLIKQSFKGDIAIWENKRYQESPIICPGEENLLRFRRWLRQFR